ncbi:MAG: AraC family transcriptional regulator [Muribaculaceae bacterium]|nr:AraC family transcriptional regulator [Muribaculaceae bacterium]
MSTESTYPTENEIEIIEEETPLGEQHFLYALDRTKDNLSYPLHRHNEFEINFIENCAGARRVVGDSVEILPDVDLVILGGGLEHGWDQNDCRSARIREITIQFSGDIFGETMMRRDQMKPIQELMEKAAMGVSFPVTSIMKVFHHLEELVDAKDDFKRLVKLMEILHQLAVDQDGRVLATTTKADVTPTVTNSRLRKAQEYIIANYKGEVRLPYLAKMAGMSPSSFSRFFKIRTGRSISDFVIGIRLDAAARELVTTSTPIAEICFNSGFNNVSNFNRIFKKNKGYTPKEYREIYKRKKFLV